MSRITCRIFCATIGARPMLGSGERAGGLVAPFREPREKLEHAGAVGSDLGAGARIRAHREVFLDAELGKHAAPLGHHDEPRARAPERGDPGEVAAVEPYRPRRRRRKTRDRAQGRRLPRAVRADQADELAPGDFEVDPLHRADASVADFETADFEQVHADCAVTATPRYASITFGSR